MRRDERTAYALVEGQVLGARLRLLRAGEIERVREMESSVAGDVAEHLDKDALVLVLLRLEGLAPERDHVGRYNLEDILAEDLADLARLRDHHQVVPCTENEYVGAPAPPRFRQGHLLARARP